MPARIVQVGDIPRTKSGKIVELAVRHVVHGRAVKNVEALANPEALELFRKILRASAIAKIPSGDGPAFSRARLDRSAEMASKSPST